MTCSRGPKASINDREHTILGALLLRPTHPSLWRGSPSSYFFPPWSSASLLMPLQISFIAHFAWCTDDFPSPPLGSKVPGQWQGLLCSCCVPSTGSVDGSIHKGMNVPSLPEGSQVPGGTEALLGPLLGLLTGKDPKGAGTSGLLGHMWQGRSPGSSAGKPEGGVLGSCILASTSQGSYDPRQISSPV